jgi:LPXTG-motif cell wall-anchored protein
MGTLDIIFVVFLGLVLVGGMASLFIYMRKED